MGFLSERDRFLQDGAKTTQRLVGQDDPIPIDEAHGKGAWAITTDGSIERTVFDEWMPLYPPGAEALIASWSPIPPGWVDVGVALGPEYEGRRLITNKPQADFP